MDKLLDNPGLVHLAENIFENLHNENLKVCEQINQSSQQIVTDPIFWLRKFTALSKDNRNDWMKALKSVKNSEKEKAIISYLQWNLKENALVDLVVTDNQTFKIPQIFHQSDLLWICHAIPILLSKMTSERK